MLRCSFFFLLLSLGRWRRDAERRKAQHSERKVLPTFIVSRGGRAAGRKTKKEEKYIKESDVLALFSHVPFTHPSTHTHPPTHTHTHTHTHRHTDTPCSSILFLSLKSLTSVLKKIVFFSIFLFFLRHSMIPV